MQTFNFNGLASPAMSVLGCTSRAVDARREDGLGFMGVPVMIQEKRGGLADAGTDILNFLTNTIDSVTGAGVQKSAQAQAAEIARIQAQARAAEAQARVQETSFSAGAVGKAAPWVAGAVAVVGVALVTVALLRK